MLTHAGCEYGPSMVAGRVGMVGIGVCGSVCVVTGRADPARRYCLSPLHHANPEVAPDAGMGARVVFYVRRLRSEGKSGLKT